MANKEGGLCCPEGRSDSFLTTVQVIQPINGDPFIGMLEVRQFYLNIMQPLLQWHICCRKLT